METASVPQPPGPAPPASAFSPAASSPLSLHRAEEGRASLWTRLWLEGVGGLTCTPTPETSSVSATRPIHPKRNLSDSKGKSLGETVLRTPTSASSRDQFLRIFAAHLRKKVMHGPCNQHRPRAGLGSLSWTRDSAPVCPADPLTGPDAGRSATSKHAASRRRVIRGRGRVQTDTRRADPGAIGETPAGHRHPLRFIGHCVPKATARPTRDRSPEARARVCDEAHRGFAAAGSSAACEAHAERQSPHAALRSARASAPARP